MNFSDSQDEIFTVSAVAANWTKLLDSNVKSHAPQFPGSCEALTKITVPPASIVVYGSV
jgi:hypothetical protein